jgi:hypothetical protein
MHTTPLPAWGATNYLRTVHCCYCLTRERARRPSHFCSTLMVAHEIGLSHLSRC